MSVDWENLAGEFVFDGSWRDVCLERTSIDDWQRALDGLRQARVPLSYMNHGEPMTLPQQARDLFAGHDRGHLLTADVGGIALNCHFFEEDEIEFDLDPREVRGQAELDALLAFMTTLAVACEKPVVLTAENVHHAVILRVEPSGQVEYLPY